MSGTSRAPRSAGIVLAAATLACAAAPEAPPRVEVRGDPGARIAVGAGQAQAPPCEVEVQAERALALAIEYGGCTLRGAVAVAYDPRAELAIRLDATLLEPAIREDLSLLGWVTDYSGATELVYVAASGAGIDADSGAVGVQDLAQRYTGPVSRGDVWSSFLFGLVTVGQGGTGPPARIQARHLAEATWIEGHGGLRGLREGSACLFVLPRDARDWIGPLFARGTRPGPTAARFDAELAAVMPRRIPQSHAVGDGAHGSIAARLTADETEAGLRRLRVDVRGIEPLEALLLVAAESTAAIELSRPEARVVETGEGRCVVAWPVPLAELARGPLELSYRRAPLASQVPP